ncbi:MAG: aldehyde dehydrogenase family protein [Clostridia bacterium]
MMELKMYINGEWQNANSGATRDIINPATGEVIARAAEGGAEEAKAAIAAAKEAFESGVWSDLPGVERARILFKVADMIEANAEELARLETMDNGKTLRESGFDMGDAAACFRYYAGFVTKPHGQTYDVADPMQAMVVREPVGVCGLITPWNFPMLMVVWKVAPALAAGNTIVIKPSEVTPVTVTKLVEFLEAAGVPKGVVNLVMGPGATVGNEIAESHDVDKVSFTGGTVTGRNIMKAAAGNIKKISLELGGKSPNIIFADADFDAAVDNALFGIYCGAGQVCSAGSRILVEESIYDKFVEAFAERAKKIRVGNGLDEQSEMGPVVSQLQMDKILGYIESGKQEGARLICGGERLTDEAHANGFFIAPTAFADCTQNMRIVQEEIFGPVAAISKFKDEEEAIKLANDTVYGLAGGVFTKDGAKAMRVIKKLRAGITWINAYHPTYNEAPWGGYKQSGIGRGLGAYGLDEFMEIKQININLQPGMVGWFEN